MGTPQSGLLDLLILTLGGSADMTEYEKAMLAIAIIGLIIDALALLKLFL